MNKYAAQAIKEYFSENVPLHVREAFSDAYDNLMNGPSEEHEYGFVTACEILKDWAEENVYDLYVNEFGDVADVEPDDYGWLCVTASQVRSILFKELADYL